MIDLSESQTQFFIYEVIGYLASLFVAISLFMTSILKLRWYLLLGNVLFVVYGFLIDSYPVVLLNLFNGGVNTYFIFQAYRLGGRYAILPAQPNSPMLQRFIEVYINDIKKFFPYFEALENEHIIFLIAKGTAVIGLTAFQKLEGGKAEVVIDYVAPTHRNMKPGKLIFHDEDIFNMLDVHTILARYYHPSHARYLKKLGFSLVDKDQQLFVLKKE
ncbi:MAG: hypothetical protein N2Z72_08025 [Bacteroidales bacterium]|nr:hypothetical protein [Bacteroidales bacterium]